MCHVVGSGTNGTGVAVACLNKNMESHVLQRQSNNKRDVSNYGVGLPDNYR